MSEPAQIEVRDLTMGYGERVVQENIRLAVSRGEIFVIMGDSGCGKSTLMRHMVGLNPPRAGDVHYDGEGYWAAGEERREALKRKFGVLYQYAALFSSMTLEENVSLPLVEHAGLAAEDARDVARLKLALVGLAGFEQHYPAEISGGMKKRAGLARAMALDPEILYFDEPSAGLAGLVGVLPVRVPGHLERPQLVTWAGPGELRVDEYLRWAEPIDAGVAWTLAENLDALLPAHPVIRSPWPAAVTPFCRVRVDLRVFGLQESGEVRLEGRWALLPGTGERPYVHRPTSLRRGPLPAGAGGADAAAGVEAMSALLADLAKEIAAAVEALPAETAEK